MKKLFGEWLKRWLLPDFANKLTWLVVSAGVSLIGLANPIFDLFMYAAEFLIREFGYSIKLPIINFNSPGWGTALVCLGLLHNLGAKYVTHQEYTTPTSH